MTDERFNEIVEMIDDELEFDVSVNVTYYDKGRTNCSNDDAYPPEIDYDIEVYNESILLDLESMGIDTEEAFQVFEENDNLFYPTINGEPTEIKLTTKFQENGVFFTLDKDALNDDFIDELVLEELENRC